jgi:flagellar hook-length control protein FliK
MSVSTNPLAGAVTAIGAVVRTGSALAREGGGASFSQWLDQRRSESPPEQPRANPREEDGAAVKEPHDVAAVGERHRRMRAAAAKAQVRPVEVDARQPADAGAAVKDLPDGEPDPSEYKSDDGHRTDPALGDALPLLDTLHRPVAASARPQGDKDESVDADAAPLLSGAPDIGAPEAGALAAPLHSDAPEAGALAAPLHSGAPHIGASEIGTVAASPQGDALDIGASEIGAVTAAPSNRRGRDALSALTQGRTALAHDDALAAQGHGVGAATANDAVPKTTGEAGAGGLGHGVITLSGLEVAAGARPGGTASITQPVVMGVAAGAASADAAVAASFAHVLAQAQDAASADVPARVAIAELFQSPAFAPTLGARLALLARDGVQHAELQLNPAEMGPISVQIALDGSRVTVDFAADVAATRNRLESSLPELAAALRESGLTLAGGGVHEQRRGRGDREPGHAAVSRSASGDAVSDAGEHGGSTRATVLRRSRGVLDEYA